jgi:hypothetical protein
MTLVEQENMNKATQYFPQNKGKFVLVKVAIFFSL